MSWNGTVNCGYCYEEGHNRRSCPALKANIARRLEDDPEDHYAKYLKQQQERGKVRRCTYCAAKGHNRRTCPDLKNDIQDWKEKCASWRNKFVKWAAENGLGPGSLIQRPGTWRADTPTVLLVRSYQWHCLNHQSQLNTAYPAGAVSLHTKNGELVTVRLPHIADLCGDDNPEAYHAPAMKILGPVKLTEEQVIAMAPQWWLDGNLNMEKDGGFKELFKDVRSKNFYDNC
jgi:hypothetical protein